MTSEASELPDEPGEVPAQYGFGKGEIGVLFEGDPASLRLTPDIGLKCTNQALDVRDPGVVLGHDLEAASVDDFLVGVDVQGLCVLHPRCTEPVEWARNGAFQILPTTAHEVTLVVLEQEGAGRTQTLVRRPKKGRPALGIDVLNGALGDDKIGQLTAESGLDGGEVCTVACDDPHVGEQWSPGRCDFDSAVANPGSLCKELFPVGAIAGAEVEHETALGQESPRACHEKAPGVFVHRGEYSGRRRCGGAWYLRGAACAC